MSHSNSSALRRPWRATLMPLAALAVATSCTENLPSGPSTFAASLAIVVAHDTIIVGDSSSAAATASDTQGRKIQNLAYAWTSSDSATVGFAAIATPDTSKGRGRMLVAKRTGRASVTLSLPDPRFVTTNVTRSEVAVVGGVRVLTTRDTTLTAVNDTAAAIAAGLARANGTLVPRASTGVRWTHLGQHVAIVGQGDTIRYVSKSNGVDTLIAGHDFCLSGAKCADTVVARVNQVLSLTLSSRSFQAWSFSDSVGPTITLADRRGNGLPGASIRFIPATAGDSALVKVSAPVGTSNPTTGVIAAPKLIASGNGAAKAYVNAIGSDGISVIAIDSVFVVIRQVARRVAVEPLRALMTSNDSIPIRPVARDARGVPIGDATISVTAVGIAVNGIWAGPSPVTAQAFAIIAPTLTGIALPASNPTAPQVAVSIDTATFTLLKPDTAIASDTTARSTSVVILDSTAVPAVGGVVNLFATAGVAPANALADVNGQVSMVWLPPDTVATSTTGLYNLTGARNTALPMNTLADSAGRIVIRRSLLVMADTASASKSTVAMNTTNIAVNGTATVTVTLRDRFNNIVKNGAPADFTVTPSGGTVGAFTCVNGVCTATYTAPNAAATVTLDAKINSSNAAMLFSPITITVF
jgi:invasin-like protein